jgi:hypothetical protein
VSRILAGWDDLVERRRSVHESHVVPSVLIYVRRVKRSSPLGRRLVR